MLCSVDLNIYLVNVAIAHRLEFHRTCALVQHSVFMLWFIVVPTVIISMLSSDEHETKEPQCNGSVGVVGESEANCQLWGLACWRRQLTSPEAAQMAWSLPEGKVQQNIQRSAFIHWSFAVKVILFYLQQWSSNVNRTSLGELRQPLLELQLHSGYLMKDLPVQEQRYIANTLFQTNKLQ